MRNYTHRLALLGAVLAGGLVLLAVGLVIALGVRSVVAEPGSAPAAQTVPSPGHAWTELQDHGVSGSDYWLGTTDNNALELRVNGARALRLEPNGTSPNVIGGYSGNSVTAGVTGAAICGGGANGSTNQVTDDLGTAAGGVGNQAGDGAGTTSDRSFATVGGGQFNTAGGEAATVGGGAYNSASELWSTVGGGGSNDASSQYAAVGGGWNNDASGTQATVGGGLRNTASGVSATISGGSDNTASSTDATVGGGAVNEATGGGATVAGGGANRASDDFCAVGGGGYNQAGDNAGTTWDRRYATVSGGYSNEASGSHSTVGGGDQNAATDHAATVGGGGLNTASAYASTVAGGDSNTASGSDATVGGGVFNTASGLFATVAGGYSNTAIGYAATIAGGGRSDPGNAATGNRVTDDYGTVGGGGNNQAGDNAGSTSDRTFATVGGGDGNTASGYSSTVGGGRYNTASRDYATVGGGYNNEATAWDATVGGGYQNTAIEDNDTVGGGWVNLASGGSATVPGGYMNTAYGPYSFAAGRQAKANNAGCFVWGDSTDADVACNDDNRFVARASGGVYLYTSGDLSTGAYLAAGSGSWSSVSDRDLKDNFTPVDGQEVLASLAEMPIATWNYEAQDPSIRHMGPAAQDFSAAFGLGESETAISTVDADGVALAAIQGLYELSQEQAARIETLEQENASLQQQLDDVERRVTALEGGTSTNGTGVGPLSDISAGWLAVLGGLVAVAGLVLVQRQRAGGER